MKASSALIGHVHLREMMRTGKCKWCKAPIPAGDLSLRFFGARSYDGKVGEIGICMPCAVKAWKEVEDQIQSISARISLMLTKGK